MAAEGTSVPADSNEAPATDVGQARAPDGTASTSSSESRLPSPRKARRAARKGSKRSSRKGRRPAAGAGSRRDGPIAVGYRFAGRISKRVLLVVVLVQLFLGLTVVLPFWQGISEHLDHHPHAAAIAGSPTAEDTALGWEAGLHPGIWRDVQREEKGLFEGLTLIHFWVSIVAWLFGAVAAGGFLAMAVSGENPVRVGAFFAHGAKWFGRMLRVGIVFGLLYYIAARLILEAWSGSIQPDEFMNASEASGWWGARLRELVVVLCFFWFRIAADLARTDLVVFGRKSAVGAAFRGLLGALRPRNIWTAMAFGVPSLVLLLILGVVAQMLVGDGMITLVLLFLVFQLAVGIRWATRAGLLAAFVARKSE